MTVEAGKRQCAQGRRSPRQMESIRSQNLLSLRDSRVQNPSQILPLICLMGWSPATNPDSPGVMSVKPGSVLTFLKDRIQRLSSP